MTRALQTVFTRDALGFLSVSISHTVTEVTCKILLCQFEEMLYGLFLN